jgi:hypothetical protein
MGAEQEAMRTRKAEKAGLEALAEAGRQYRLAALHLRDGMSKISGAIRWMAFWLSLSIIIAASIMRGGP